MAACGTQEQHAAVLAEVRAVYLPWLESTSRHLQHLLPSHEASVARQASVIEPAAGRVVLFADGLRLDVAQQLTQQLTTAGFATVSDWEWSANLDSGGELRGKIKL